MSTSTGRPPGSARLDAGDRVVYVEREGAEAAPALGIVPDHEALLRYEAGLERLVQTLPVSVLCFYDRPAFGCDLAPFVRLHRRSVTDRQMHASSRPGRVVVAGEIDSSNVELLRTLLAATPAVDGELALDLGELDFIGVAGTAAVVERARELAPERLRVIDPPPHLIRVVTVTGWDNVLHLTFGGATR